MTEEQEDHKLRKILASARKYILIGLLTAIPIWATWLVIDILLELLASVGRPFLVVLSKIFEPFLPPVANLLMQPWFQTLSSILLVLLLLYILGRLASQMIGKRLLGAFESFIERIPLLQLVYGTVKKLLSSLQKKPDNAQRVVFIDFPSPEMKTVGLVTRTFKDADTGRSLAAVYVPTTPNPTSGYLEIVPLDKVTSTDWSVDEAMTFIVSGGIVSPDRINYEKGVVAAPSQTQN